MKHITDTLYWQSKQLYVAKWRLFYAINETYSLRARMYIFTKWLNDKL